MSPKEKQKIAARPWFQFALTDLKAAKFLLTGKAEFSRKICFDCQQAVEKTLKGFLVYNGIKIDKPLQIHNLRELSVPVLKIDPSLKDLLAGAVELTPYAIAYRYPDASLKEPTINDAQEAIRIAEKVFTEITKKIPTGTQWGI